MPWGGLPGEVTAAAFDLCEVQKSLELQDDGGPFSAPTTNLVVRLELFFVHGLDTECISQLVPATAQKHQASLRRPVSIGFINYHVWFSGSLKRIAALDMPHGVRDTL